MRKQAPAKESKGLVPTKAALFGLDVRFRKVDQAILEEKLRRNAFRRKKSRDQSAPSRHSLPMQRQYLTTASGRHPTMRRLQAYAKAGEVDDDESGLKLIQFDRKPEQPKPSRSTAAQKINS